MKTEIHGFPTTFQVLSNMAYVSNVLTHVTMGTSGWNIVKGNTGLLNDDAQHDIAVNFILM